MNNNEYMPYTELIEIFKEINLDYQKEGDLSFYITSINTARKIMSEYMINYKKVAGNEESLPTELQKEILRPVTYRQSYCIVQSTSFFEKKLYTSAMNELVSAIEDNSSGKSKEYVSMNEFYLLYKILEKYSIQQ